VPCAIEALSEFCVVLEVTLVVRLGNLVKRNNFTFVGFPTLANSWHFLVTAGFFFYITMMLKKDQHNYKIVENVMSKFVQSTAVDLCMMYSYAVITD